MTTVIPVDTSPRPGSTVATPTTAANNPSTAIPAVIATVPAADSVLAVIAEHPDLSIFAELVDAFVGTGQGSVFTQA